MENNFSEFFVRGSEKVKKVLKNPENRKWIINNASEGRTFVLQSEWLETFTTRVFSFSVDGFDIDRDQLAKHTIQVLIWKNKKLFFDMIDCDLPTIQKTVQLVSLEPKRQFDCSNLIEQFSTVSTEKIILNSEAASAIITILFYKWLFLGASQDPEHSSVAFDYYDAVLKHYKSLPIFIEIEKLL